MNPEARIRIAIGLPLRNLGTLTNFLNAVYDPASPQFHQFLTSTEFTEAFGPSQQDYDRLMAFAQGSGFLIDQSYANRVLLDVTGTVGAIESALHTHLMVYQHPTENRTFYAPDTEPTVEVSVPILDIGGLEDFHRPHPLVHPSSLKNPPTPLAGSGSFGTYLGKDFRAAYAPNVAVTGVGQVVGLLEFDGYYANDISSYETLAGLPNVSLSNVLLDGYNGSPGGNNIEVALDIEMAISMAPGLNKVIVYEAGPSGLPNDILNRMVTDNLAKQLSSSWSWTGGGSSDSIFLQMASQGQSFFQASGDSDAYPGAAPQPCDDPYITIVGGTTLSTSGPGGNWVSEKTWNWYNDGSGTNGSSGGISTTYSIPTWQQTVSMASNQGSTTMRNFPDVAFTADNIWVTYNNGSSGAVGGTSCAAPLWAAFTALINQQALANGKAVMGFINPSLYSIAQGTGYSSAFHDITTGNNTNKTSPSRFSAVSGFDLCTGWGTPAGSGLINALAGAPTPQIVSNSLALTIESCTNGAVDPGETVTMSFGLSNVGSSNTTNLVATLQPTGGVTSPSGAQTYGALIAGGASVSRSFTFTANGSCGGSITATFQLQDGASNLGTVTFTVRLGAITTVTAFSEGFDGVSAPGLPSGWSTSVASGLLKTWVTTNGSSDTAPNSVFAADAGTAGQTVLVSPLIPIQSATAQLTFRHNEALAVRTTSHPKATNYYDGGVLQISIGGGAFIDILTAGGSFSAGGYNCTLATGISNPLGGGQAWGGSNGWVTTIVLLPSSAAGQNIQLKWALGTGSNSSVGTGWFVDSVSMQDHVFDCCSSSADVGVSQSAAPNPAVLGQNLVYTLTISNGGPSVASSLAITDALPSNVSFVSASPGCVNLGNAVACSIANLAAGRVSNILVTVKPSSTVTLTNAVTVSSTPMDPNSANNLSTSTVVVDVPSAITMQPTNQVTVAGGSANFYVGGSGSAPLTYQWRFGGNNLTSATTSALALSNVQASQAGNYDVVVGNAVGSVTSSVATLTVLVPPSITSQPTNQTVALGSNAIFQVGASGSAPLSYQWMFNGANISGSTSSNIALSNVQTNQAGIYSVVVTNSVGSVTSAVATLTVVVPPSITQQPANQTTVVGSNVTFQAAASGSSPLSYQWYFGGSILSGRTGVSLNLTNVQTGQAGNYLLVASNSAGSATSVVAQLTALVPPSIATQPTNQSAVSGANVNFQVSASGTAPLSYQWWFNGTNSVGGNTNILTLTAVQPNQAGQYNVVITNSAGAVTSSLATLTVVVPPNITQQPSNQTTLQGGNAIFQAAASGSSPLGYQWYFGGSILSGQTATSLSLANVQPSQAGNYQFVVANSAGSATSAVAQLTVLVPPTITTQPTNQFVVSGGNASFLVNATGTAPLVYQWWFNGTNAVGSSTNTLGLTNVQLSQAGQYDVVITNSAGSVTSSLATLTVVVPPNITQQPSNQTTVQGGNATFQAAASGSSPLGYQWYFGASILAGQNGTSLNLTNIQTGQAGNYQFVATNAAGAATSAVAQLTVLLPPSITAQPTNQSTVSGGNVNFQVNATGTAPLVYQWWFNVTNAVGTSTNVLTLANVQLSQAGQYSVLITNSAGTVTSSVATLTVVVPPNITQQPSNQTTVLGGSAAFQAVASGSSPLGYQWYFGGSILSGQTATTLSLTNVQTNQAGNYQFVVTNAAGSTTSAVAQLTVLVPPSITSQPTNQSVVSGGSASFLVKATGTSPLVYQWWFNGSNVVGANTNTLSLTNVQTNQAGQYNVVITNSAGSVTSLVASLTVGTPPLITQQPTNLSVVQGQSASFTVAVTGDAPLNYQWRFNGSAITAGTASSYFLSGVTSTEAGNYDAVISNAYGAITSGVAQLTVLVPPTITSQPTNQTVAAGSNVLFLVNASGSAPLGFQWWFNATNAVGGNTNAFSVTNAQSAQAGDYFVVVTNSAGSVTSAVATLTIGVAPFVSQQPTNLVVVQGQSASFAVGVSGTNPLTYSWWFNGSFLSGATGSSYTIPAVGTADAGSYSAVVSNSYGAVTSTVAQLTVLVAPSISAQPTNQTVVQGGTALFQADVAGSAPLGFQWWFNNTNAVGINSNILTITNAQLNQAGGYSLVATNAAGSVTSIVALLTVGTPPGIIQSPASLTIVQGQDANFAVAATGYTPLSYVWRFNGVPINGSGGTNYLVSSAQPINAGAYDVVITNDFGSLTSSVAQLTVLVPPTVVTQPTNQTSLVGGTVSFYAQASGSGPLSYQWSFNGNALAGATTNFLLLSGIQATQAGPYILVVSNSAGFTTTSAANLKVLVQPLANDPVKGPSGYAVSLSSVVGLSYLLEYKNALQDPSWTPTSGWYSGTGGILILQDTNSPTGTRFFRIRCE